MLSVEHEVERMGRPIESSRNNDIPVVLDKPAWNFQEYIVT